MHTQALRKNAITFLNEVPWDQGTPVHIKAFRDHLLDFHGTITSPALVGDDLEAGLLLPNVGVRKIGPGSNLSQFGSLATPYEQLSNSAKLLLAQDATAGPVSPFDRWYRYYDTNFVSQIVEGTKAIHHTPDDSSAYIRSPGLRPAFRPAFQTDCHTKCCHDL